MEFDMYSTTFNLESYGKAALAGEVEKVANAPKGDRNNQLSRSAAAVGSLLPSGALDEQEARLGLERAASGLIATDGIAAVRATIAGGLRWGREHPREIPANDNRPSSIPNKIVGMRDYRAATPDQAAAAPIAFPAWTLPDANGKPRFDPAGEDGPLPQANEIRRHVYAAGGVPVRIKIKYKDGERTPFANWYRVVDPNGTEVWQAKKPAGYLAVPFTNGIDLFDPEVANDAIFLPEGEKDVVTMTKHGNLALTFGGASDLPDGCEKFVAGRDVVILSDSDDGGRRHAEAKAALCARVATSVKVIQFPELPTGGDVSDWFEAGHTDEELRDRVEAAPAWVATLQDAANSNEPAKGDYLVVRRASEIKPEAVEWLWPGRIAIGKETLIAGDPGLGKSQLTAFVAATVTTGGYWPCDEGRATIGNVIILSAEDDPADTIVPRLLALDADLDRILIVEAVTTSAVGGRRMFHLARDLAMLEMELDQQPETRLVIIDPITAYMSGIDTHRTSDVRGVLALLSEMAARRRVAVVCVSHLNKNAAGAAISRVTGSGAFVAAARAAYIVAKDQADNLRRLFVPNKNNNAKDDSGLAFRIEQRMVGKDATILAPRVAWESEPVRVTADEALGAAASSSDRATATDDATEFLQNALAAGPVDVKELEAEARAAGLLKTAQAISQSKPLRDAKESLGIESHRKGFGTAAKYHWQLPGSTMDDPEAMDAPF
jgi:putative DNA primase/helicase